LLGLSCFLDAQFSSSRIYAARFGGEADYQQSLELEDAIEDYRLHLLDVVPTIKQIEFETQFKTQQPSPEKLVQPSGS